MVPHLGVRRSLRPLRGQRRRMYAYLLAGCPLVIGPSGCAGWEVGLPWPSPDSPPTPIPSEPEAITELERQVHDLVNRHRSGAGLPPLRLDAGASEVAREHSRDMARRSVPFGHAGFDGRAEAIGRRIPYSSIAENVAWNDHPIDRTAPVAVDGWVGSAGHRVNIEGAYQVTGIGVATGLDGRHYYTQIFIAPR